MRSSTRKRVGLGIGSVIAVVVLGYAAIYFFLEGGVIGQATDADRTAGDPILELEQLLDDQPAFREIVETAKTNGLHAGLEALRHYHSTTKVHPYLRLGLKAYSPEDAKRLADERIAKGFRYEKFDFFPLDSPIDWKANPFNNRSWRFRLHSWTFLDAALIAYREYRTPEYIEFVTVVALDWDASNGDPAVESDFAWYDMAVGRRAAALAVIVDDALRNAELPDKDLMLLLKMAGRHAQYLSQPANIAYHSNHGLYQLSGLHALAEAVPELRGTRWQRRFALSSLFTMLMRDFSAEGIHLEHSTGYHFFLTNLANQLIRTGWLNEHRDSLERFARAQENALWMVHPNGTIARIGDTDYGSAEKRVMDVSCDEMRFVLTEGKDGKPPDTTFKVFPKSGYAAFRGPWETTPWENASYLFFTATFHSRAHKQADDFTFEWSELGRHLLVDVGKYGYFYEEPGRVYAESTRAHNTVEIDERDYSRYRLDAFGSAIRQWGQADGVYYVEAQVYRKRFFKTDHRRILVFDPGRWLVVIDRLHSGTEHKYTQWFHFGHELELIAEGLTLSGLVGAEDKRLIVMPLVDKDVLELHLIKGRKEPRYQGWTSLAPRTLTPNFAGGYTTTARDRTFVTLLRLADQDSKVLPGESSVSPDGHDMMIRWSVDGREEGFSYTVNQDSRNLDVVP